MELFAAVALLSWSSTHVPSVFKSSTKYLSTIFSSYLTNQHVVFLVGNLIVVICYILSRYTDSGINSVDSGIQSVPSEVTESLESPECQVPAVLNEMIVKTASEERFKRTRSEKVAVRPRRELRRSVTEMRRGVAVGSGGGESPVNSVEKLSNEEFRVRVEAFILKQQRLLKQQIVVEDAV